MVLKHVKMDVRCLDSSIEAAPGSTPPGRSREERWKVPRYPSIQVPTCTYPSLRYSTRADGGRGGAETKAYLGAMAGKTRFVGKRARHQRRPELYVGFA